MTNDYFLDSVPDGIANGVMELFPDILVSGQEGYELLINTFGSEVDGKRFKSFSEEDCKKVAHCIQDFLEIEGVSAQQGRTIIEIALRQWGG